MTLLRDRRRDGRDVATIKLEPLVRYEEDAYTWALQQSALLRAGRLAELDLTNLADEVEDAAGREYDKLGSALARVLQHLLEWDYQPERRSRSWVLTIREHRSRVLDQLGDYPGLKSALSRAVARAYRSGRSEALLEADLPDSAIPENNPYAWDDIVNRVIDWPPPD